MSTADLEPHERAKRYRRAARFWEANLVLAVAYPFLPSWAEKWMLAYLAAVSIWALKLGEDSKAEAAEAAASTHPDA